jgi:hypothetical protein
MVKQLLVGQGLLIIESLQSHTRRTTLGRTPLEEGSTRRRDLYLTTHNTHERQTSIPPAGFEPPIPTGIDVYNIGVFLFFYSKVCKLYAYMLTT